MEKGLQERQQSGARAGKLFSSSSFPATRTDEGGERGEGENGTPVYGSYSLLPPSSSHAQAASSTPAERHAPSTDSYTVSAFLYMRCARFLAHIQCGQVHFCSWRMVLFKQFTSDNLQKNRTQQGKYHHYQGFGFGLSLHGGEGGGTRRKRPVRSPSAPSLFPFPLSLLKRTSVAACPVPVL